MGPTSSRLFVNSPDRHGTVVECIKQHAPHLQVTFDGAPLYYFAVVRILLRSFHGMHSLWSLPSTLTPHQVVAHADLVGAFGKAWHALQWKPTVWVHWTVAHCHFL